MIRGAWEEGCASRLEPCTLHLCSSYSATGETQTPPFFAAFHMGCSNSSQYREVGETLGLDTHCLLPMPVWDASEPPGTLAPPSTPAKPRLHAGDQPSTGAKSWVTFSTLPKRPWRSSDPRQHSSPEVLPFLIQLHIHYPPNFSLQSSAWGIDRQQRGAAQRQEMSAQTHTTVHA